MKIGSRIEGRKAVLSPEGKMTVHASPELSAVVDALPGEACDIDIDLRNVDYVPSAGLRALVASSKLSASRGGLLRILHTQPRVLDVFDIAGLANVLSVER